MKCLQCEKPATFHITELTDDDYKEVHLCEECARSYQSHGETTSGPQSVIGAMTEQLQIGQTADELERLDKQSCPVCGITFYDFRHAGRLGCPTDLISSIGVLLSMALCGRSSLYSLR